ncbi:MAG: FGGY-family carbohydrate kinase [Planctomycetota bacterium]|nr:FGGY-family carbohydrate kinase [Planctomycetota bacterium]
MPTILNFDLGTTYFKCCLFDERGELLAVHRAAPPIEHPLKDQGENRWELPVEGFRAAIRAGVAGVGKASPAGLRDVAGVGFATQANSFCLLDAKDEPLTPLILWPDERAGEFAEAMRAIAALPGFRARTGVPELVPVFMAAKLLWLQRHERAAWARATRVSLISDYLTLWLTGERMTDAGVAGLSGMADVRTLKWLPDVLGQVRLRDGMLSRIVRPGTVAGPVMDHAADALGLPRGCRFVIGSLDQYAGAIGAGNISAGGVSETTGTVLAAVRCAASVDPGAASGEYQGPSFREGAYYRMSFGSTSANLLEWYQKQLPDGPTFESLGEAAAMVEPGAGGLKVKARADLEKSLCAGVPGAEAIRGSSNERGQVTRAIMEAVAFALRDHLAVLCADGPAKEVRSTGGAARSPLWMQIKADVVGLPFAATVCPEPTSLGAAILTGAGLGWGTVEELAGRWVRTRPACVPDAARHAMYQRLGSPVVP